MARFFLSLALCWSMGCAQPAQPPAPKSPAPTIPEQKTDFTGTWNWKQGDESLILDLKQDGAKVTGYHSAVGQRGSKVDETTSNAPQPSIQGDINDNVATVQFHSGYPEAKGHGTAKITLREDKLYWEIVSSEGEHYFPKSARLSRAP